MIDKLERLKEKIINGTTTNKDIDIINDVIKCIQKKEEIQNVLTESLIETEEAMMPTATNIEIGVVNIYYSQEKKTAETEKDL